MFTPTEKALVIAGLTQLQSKHRDWAEQEKLSRRPHAIEQERFHLKETDRCGKLIKKIEGEM